VRRNVLRAPSSFKVGPSSNSFHLSSSLHTPNTSWPALHLSLKSVMIASGSWRLANCDSDLSKLMNATLLTSPSVWVPPRRDVLYVPRSQIPSLNEQ
jgi:hypothetical protein